MKNQKIKYKFAFFTFFKGLLFFALASFLIVSLLSYHSSDSSFNHVNHLPIKNMLGVYGAYAADFLLQFFGMGAMIIAVAPLFWSWQCLKNNLLTMLWLKVLSLLIAAISFAVLVSGLHDYIFPVKIEVGVLGKELYKLIPNTYKLAFLPALLVIFLFSTYSAFGIKLESWSNTFQKIFFVIVAVARVTSYILLSIYRIIAFVTQKLMNRAEGRTPPPYQNMLEETIAKATQPIKKPTSKPLANFKTTDLNFILPDPNLLSAVSAKTTKSNLSTSLLEENAQKLLKVLMDFGVRGKMLHYYPGPVVTLYEFEPAAGTKSSRIIGLADDIARSMCALSTRIATIPGKNSIGIELPNQTRETVYLKEMIDSDEYQQAGYSLPIILGKDIGGTPIVVDLATMPHLLVAGTTGSGKSVAINTMILSLLYRLTPEQCKLVMIDPKMLELSAYDGIPHLLAPVVTEPSKAIVALKWTVKEMENRYRLMASLGVRNIAGYNQKIEEAKTSGKTLSKQVQTGFDQETGRPIYEDIALDVKTLPYIVVIVDEMADLMIVAGKEIEASIQRLAQMARAAGIHIIMATQRPSVDVITGVIKANFPTRISFHVTSKIDSRTILGESGAEQLLGKGDMLYLSGGNKIRRIHGPFVADSEVENVVRFLKTQAAPVFTVDITSGDEDDDEIGSLSAQDRDELYEQAVSLIKAERKVSISYIQRYFRIGYNRAATIVEQMEKSGIVSKADAVGKREILIGE